MIIVQSVMHESEQEPVEEITRIPTWTNRPEPNNDPNKEDEDVQPINDELPPEVSAHPDPPSWPVRHPELARRTPPEPPRHIFSFHENGQ